MNLPELPKQHKKKEADFGLLFRRWIDKNSDRYETASFELKHTRGMDNLFFSEMKTEQIVYANCIHSDKGILIRVEGTKGEPDYIWMRNQPAWIVIKYPTFFCLISIENFIKERDSSPMKSLSSQAARRIAAEVIDC